MENQQTKKKMKKWQIALIVIGIIIAIGAIGNANDSTDVTTSTSVETSATENADKKEDTNIEKEKKKETEKKTEPPTKSPEETEKEFKESCSEIDFKTLSRNPDKHKGEKYKMTGEVIQVQEATFEDTVDLRINVTKEVTEFEYSDDLVLWTDTIYATVELDESEDRILQDDIITFWGTCDGMYNYTSVLGSTVSLPKIDIEYFELVSE